jgi:hypothetical protein
MIKINLKKPEAFKMLINILLISYHRLNIKNLFSNSKPRLILSPFCSISVPTCSSLTTQPAPSLCKIWKKLSKICSTVFKIIARRELMAMLDQPISSAVMHFQSIASKLRKLWNNNKYSFLITMKPSLRTKI